MGWKVRIAALVLLVLGLACLNYTTDTGAEHHREWAAEHDLPPPSPAIFYGGAVATVLGALLFGRSLGRRGEA